MKRSVLLLISAVFALSAARGFAGPQTFALDTSHGTVGFSVKHMVISNVKGHFGEYVGQIQYDPDTQTLVSAECTIQANSITTANKKRDDHLKGPDFFDVAKYPTIEFKSTSVHSPGQNVFHVTGNLTMHGVTKEVTLPFAVTGPITDPWGNVRIGYSIESELNRRDFKISFENALADGGLVVGETVLLDIEGEGVKQ